MSKFIKMFIGDNVYRQCFLILGVLLQIFAYIISPQQNWLSLFSGITGIFAVVLCAERKLVYYLFAWPQLISYVILAYQQKLYGEIYENIFYAITMIIGMFVWIKHMSFAKEHEYTVNPKTLSKKSTIIIIIGMILCIIGLWRYLVNYTDDTQPLLDSISTIPAFIAQILLTFRYREQWLFWLIINIASIFMWGIVENYCMVTQYIFWSINCLLGYKCWKNE